MNTVVFVVIIIILFFILLLNCNQEDFHLDPKSLEYFNPNHPPIDTNKTIKQGRIFVSIASYRDAEVLRTVRSLLENCSDPGRLTVCVYEQNSQDDPSVLELGELLDICNFVHLTTDYRNALGPTWARYYIQRHWDGEEYFLQIDSHTVFVSNWDLVVIGLLESLPPKSVLTQYLPEYDIESGKYNPKILRGTLYVEGFRPVDNFTRIQSEYHKGLPPRRPFVSEAWGACFSFSGWEIIRDAPYDPNLPYLFFGEELDITLRLYTRGWNFYSPNKNIAFTCFKRSHRRTIWSDHNEKTRKNVETLSRFRLYKRFQMESFISPKFDITKLPHDNLQLGNTRTIQDYENFAGIDLKKQRVKGHNKRRIMSIGRPKQLEMNGIGFFDYILSWWNSVFYIF